MISNILRRVLGAGRIAVPSGRIAEATVGGQVIARSDRYRKLEGNVYFPPDAVNRALIEDSTRASVCPWKGVALYYTVRAGDEELPHAAWYYPDPSPAAEAIRDHVAFDWRVRVRETRAG